MRAFEAKQARGRADKAEKVSTALVKNHDVLALEDLSLLNLTASATGTVENPGRNVRQKAGLNRALLDVGFGRLRTLIQQKALRYGTQVVFVPPAFTSQRCNWCGHTSALNRTSRDWFCCVRCQHSGCADTLAAQNILALALFSLRKFNPEDVRVQLVEPSTRYGVEAGIPQVVEEASPLMGRRKSQTRVSFGGHDCLPRDKLEVLVSVVIAAILRNKQPIGEG